MADDPYKQLDEQLKRTERLTALVMIIVVLAFLAAWLGIGRGCSTAPKVVDTVTVTSTSTSTDVGGSCGDLSIGETKREACPVGDGYKEWECQASGLVLEHNDCGATATETHTGTGTGTGRRPCGEVTTFDELQPVLAQNCAGCHSGIDVYDRARTWFDKMNARIKLPASNADHMPKGSTLDADKIKVFDEWKDDGFLKADECEAGGRGGEEPPAFVSFAQAEQAMFSDATSQPAVDQKALRYLLFADRIDAAAALAELKVWKDAAAKTTASVSVERELFPPVEIAPGILRINIDDLGIAGAKWKLIEDSSLLQLESFTTVGKALKDLTGSRLPWFPVSEFNDTVLRNARVYYTLTDSPATFGQLAKNLGVDFAGDLAAFKAQMIGFNGSQLSPAANRLMSRHDADGTAGFFWTTYDTGPIVSDDQNLFKNPLLFEAGGKANLRFAAGEVLYTLPNGMMGSYLALAKQVFKNGRFDHSELDTRLDFADPNVVHDFTSNPLSPIIRNAVSCFRCHAGGILRATDQVLASVTGPGNPLGADDAQRARVLFHPGADNDAVISRDSGRFAAAMRQLGVDPTQPDPITKVSDRFLGDLSLVDVAALFFQKADDFASSCLNLSAQGKAQAGQLLTGGTISHDQLVQVLPVLKVDCRLFQDPLSGGAQ